MHMQICPGHKFVTCQQWLPATPQTFLLTLLPLCHYLERKNLPKPTVMFSKKVTTAGLGVSQCRCCNKSAPFQYFKKLHSPPRSPLASGASYAHHQKSPVTLRTETGKPVPFLYFCSFFSTHSNFFPLGASPPPKVSFSKALALSIKLTHPCLALTLVSLYLPGELTSYTAQ